MMVNRIRGFVRLFSRTRASVSKTQRIRNPRSVTLGHDQGLATVEILVIVTFTLTLFVLVVNLIAVQFGAGMLRNAVDDGARYGTRVTATELASHQPDEGQSLPCLERMDATLGDLGPLATNIERTCVIANDRVVARVSATFTGWLLPDLNREYEVSYTKERVPPPLPDPEATATQAVTQSATDGGAVIELPVETPAPAAQTPTNTPAPANTPAAGGDTE